MGNQGTSSDKTQICATCGTTLGGPVWPGMGPRYCREHEPRPHVVYMNFQLRKAWEISFLESDARTSLKRSYRLPDEAAVRGLVTRTRPDDATLADFDRSMNVWSRGTVKLLLTDEQYRRIKLLRR